MKDKKIYFDGQEVDPLSEEEVSFERIILIPWSDEVEADLFICKEGNSYYMDLGAFIKQKRVKISKEYYESCRAEFAGESKDIIYIN